MAFRRCSVPQEIMDAQSNRPLEFRVAYTCPNSGEHRSGGPTFYAGRGAIIKCSDAIALEAMDQMEGDGWKFFEPVSDEPPPTVNIDWDAILVAHLAAEAQTPAPQEEPPPEEPEPPPEEPPPESPEEEPPP